MKKRDWEKFFLVNKFDFYNDVDKYFKCICTRSKS